MFSVFPGRIRAWCVRSVLAMGFMVMAAVPGISNAQEETAVEPMAPTRVIVHGTTSYFDLANLGPDFSEPWLRGLLPASAAADGAPVLTERITTVPEANGWAQQTRTTYDRTANGRLRERRVERWKDSSWTNASRTTYTYRDGALVRQQTAVWMEGAWQQDRRITFERDAQGQVRTVLHQERRGERWANAARLLLFPADTGQQRLVRETWSDGTWTPVTRVTFTVAEEGRHIVQHNETRIGDRWEDSVRLTFLYDGAGYPIEKSVEVWTGERWAEGPLHLYDYQVHERRVEQRAETWVGTNRIRTERTELTYAAPLRAWLSYETSPFD